MANPVDEAVSLGKAAASRLAELADCLDITISPGLTDREFAVIESDFAFEFADDHRAFLAEGLPVGEGWPDWRNGHRHVLQEALNWPNEGVLFDIEQNDFWMNDWGERPSEVSQRLNEAKLRLAQVPKMVPIYRHRALPAGRGSFGHAVLSIYQTDIIVYGKDILRYIDSEFNKNHEETSQTESNFDAWEPRWKVDFWWAVMDGLVEAE